MKMLFRHPESDQAVVVTDRARSSIYDMLLYTVLQRPRGQAHGGIVIALSSSNPGEGVSYVSKALLRQLAKCEVTSAAGVNVSFLRKLHEPTREGIRNSMERSSTPPKDERKVNGNRDNLAVVTEHGGTWEGSWQYRKDRIELLRNEFDYTIIDCPSLKQSGDLLALAPFVDGVVMVIEANRTRREQPCLAEKNIRAVGGTLLGYVLNKQKREAPRWLVADA